ncbi:hypothetical protein ACJMK2_030817 [Sinanodonta woodiana]|uniref:Mitochondria-eating protein n=1 Tax=Sinanodonta woodiana TaxID=1069815 RepID=A0ABD3WXG6_SINWO
MAASKRSQFSVDVADKRLTKGTEKEKRLPNLDNEFIITTRVETGLKRWKFLQTVISRKQEKVAKGAHSKWLEHYKKERDELVEQMQVDFPELQSIFYDEYSSAFDRKDKRRTTTGGIRKYNRETLSLQSTESEINQLKSQLENEKKSKEEALFNLQSTESEINQLKSQLENERKSKEEVLSNLRSAESEINELRGQLEKERMSKAEALSRLNKKLDESENGKAALKLSHQEEIVFHKEEIRKFQERLAIDKSYEARAKELKTKCDELETELARQVRDNNPNTVELSDPNRPTKLSGQFSKLYDNEWTDAFDELKKLLSNKEEKQIISYLRDFVLEIYSVCSDLSLTKMKTIEEAIVKPSVPSEDTKITTEILKTIKDGIKSMAPKLLEHTRELVLGRLEEKYFMDPVSGCLQHEHIKRYIDKCTEVCWYMSVQDPQMFMEGSKSPDDKFDSIKHREYTKKGPYEDFVVWPALYLYKGGSMLSKGVAQGTQKEMIEQP